MEEGPGQGKQPGAGEERRPGDYSAPGLGAPSNFDSPGPVMPGGGGGTTGGVPPEPPGRAAPIGRPPRHVAEEGAGIPPSEGIPPLPRRSEFSRKRGGGLWTIIIVAAVAAVIGALVILVAFPWAFGVNPWDLVRGKVGKKDGGTAGTTRERVKIVTPTEGAVGVAAVAKKAIPSVVNIDIRTEPQTGFFFELTPQEGTGSGVIYSSDGYILTNYHVVRDANEITVTLSSGKEHQGRMVGTDPESDIAVIKIDETGLPTLRMGDSDSLTVGELVIAVGSPFGFEHSVTSGIISALHRSVSAGTQDAGQQGSIILTDLVQTDAAINPGNSGGALCDSKSRLVGVNAVIATAAGGSEGVGFAVPVNTAKKVADDIIAGRPVSHPYIGVLGQTIDSDIAKRYELPVKEGAYVTRIVPDGPAAKAGIQTGDIIVEMDGEQVESMDDVVSIVRRHNVGDKLSITYYSGKDKKTAEVTLEEKPSQQ